MLPEAREEWIAGRVQEIAPSEGRCEAEAVTRAEDAARRGPEGPMDPTEAQARAALDMLVRRLDTFPL